MDRRSKLLNAQKFTVYYGKDDIDLLREYDIAVVEPAALNDSQTQNIQNFETMVIAYLSFLEIPHWSSLLTYLADDDFIHIEGVKLINPEYGNYCANLSSAKWQQILLHKVSELLTLRSFDGVFLDTIGFLEYDQIPLEIQDIQIRSAQSILRRIRGRFPDHILIQNGGLSEVIYSTKSYIDGICWENPCWEKQGQWSHNVAYYLAELQHCLGLKVFLLFENADIHSPSYMKAKELEEKNGFLIFNAANSYTGIKSALEKHRKRTSACSQKYLWLGDRGDSEKH